MSVLLEAVTSRKIKAMLAMILSMLAAALVVGVQADVARAGSGTFSNTRDIQIRGDQVATPYKSDVTASGLPAGEIVTDINVTLNTLSHTWASNLQIMLVNPAGQSVILMSRAGAPGDVSAAMLTFDDEAAGRVPGRIPSGANTYKPTNYGGPAFPSPAPDAPYGDTLSDLDGYSANGTYSLYVVDSGGEPADGGWIFGGFSIAITTALPECSDGADNDSDGKTDFDGANPDLGCNSLTDNSENSDIDTTPPDTTITSGPTEGSTVGSTDQAFEFTSTESGSSFECSVDNGATYQSCSSGDTFTFTEGSNTFEVKATDAAGNQDSSAATRTFTVDTTAPDTTITDGPSGTVNSSSVTFEFSSQDNSTFQCKLDGGTFAACDAPKTLNGLSDGQHTFSVKAADAAGNEDASAATRTFTVDTTTPDTTAPTVSATTPTGKMVARNTNVTATFSEGMDEASIEAAGTVKLVQVGRKGKTTPVAATVSYDPATKTVTLDPSGNLKRKATHTATITTSAKDEAGNAQARPETWTFTTARR